MSIYDSKLWISDLDEVLMTLPEMKDLAGKSVMITGCTGLICSAIVDLIIRWNETGGERIRILAAGRSEKRVKDRFLPYVAEEWFEYVQYDASAQDNALYKECDFIIHGASNASPSKIVKEPVETMLSNFIGLKQLLDYAKNNNIKRVLFISSSEVYGKKEGNTPYKSNDYGYVDLLNPRNSYAVAKRAAETLCTSYSDEYGIETVIVRPGHIYGPTAMISDNRVSSVWPNTVAKGEDIVMKSNGMQIRSYCYCLDCATAILKVMLKGENSSAYNISNPDSVINIHQMATILSNVGGVKLRMELPTEDEKKGFNPMSNSSLDSKALIELGWKGLFDAYRGFSHTVNIIKETNLY